MQLLEIYCDNLYSFKEMTLDFTKYEKGTTIILGKNLNMDSSNGAGKSSILKSIFFALWGSDLNKVPLDGIVNDSNPDKGFLSRIKFKDDKNTYTITRFKNYKNPDSVIKLMDGNIPKGSAVELMINDEVFYAPKDNNKIERLVLGALGMSSEIFLSSVLTGQKRTENFLSSPDTIKKEILSEILDLNQYDVAAKHLDKDLKEKKDLINHKESKLEEFQKFTEKLHDDVKDFKIQATTFNNELKEKIGTINEETKTFNAKVNELKAKKDTVINTEVISQSIEDLAIKILVNEKLLKDFDTIRDKLSKINILIERNNSSKENNNKVIKDLSLKISNLEKSSLNKSTLENDLIDISSKLKELDSVVAEAIELESKMATLESSISELTISITKKNSSIQDVESKERITLSNLKKTKDDNQCFTCERGFETSNPLIDGLEKELIKIKENKTLLLDSMNSIQSNIDSAKGQMVKFKESFLTYKTKIEEKESLAVKTANINNSLLRISEAEAELVLIKTNLDKANNDLVTADSNLAKLNDELNKYTKIIESLHSLEKNNKVLVVEKDKLQTEKHLIEKSNSELASIGALIESHENTIKKLEKDLSSLRDGKNPYLELIMKKTLELKNYEENFNKMTEEVKSLNNKYQLLKFWEQGFSKNGIKSFIIDEVISLLNLKVKEYLTKLSGGAVSLFFEPEKIVKKHGTTKNEITTKIYINGKLKHPNAPSGGEEDRLTLAVDLALSDIAESRSGTKFNIKFLDEPFKWVDNKGQMKALALFNELSANRQGFFLISHDEKMQSFCDNAIFVVNENGISRIVTKEDFLNLK